MIGRVVASVLRSLVGDYVEGIHTENLKMGLRKGDVTLTNLNIKPTALEALQLPLIISKGTVGVLHAKVPWTHLTSKPVILTLEDVFISVVPETHDAAALDRIKKARARSIRILDDLREQAEDEIVQDVNVPEENLTSTESSETDPSTSNATTTKKLTKVRSHRTFNHKKNTKDSKTKDRILDNLIVDVKNVVIRYEGEDFACCIQMDQLTLHTTDDDTHNS